MKAMGEYIHRKGLKFGIYQDRGELTCQGLPGSLKHEQIDMATFAEWGVDYIKLDSCHAERNGRMSSADYAIFQKAIKATGRPMVLSISDFGNAAWAWGGTARRCRASVGRTPRRTTRHGSRACTTRVQARRLATWCALAADNPPRALTNVAANRRVESRSGSQTLCT